MAQSRRNNFWVPVILLMLFIGPIVVAVSLYSSKSPWIEETVNYGQLIQPMLDFSQLKLKDAEDKALPTSVLSGGQWLILYVSKAPCAAVCQKNLYNIRQVWVALGKDMDRVQRVLITTSPQTTPELKKLLAKDYVGTEHFFTSAQQLDQFFAKTPGALYLVDPHKNVMMVYQADFVPKGLLADLKRLLNVSQIG